MITSGRQLRLVSREQISRRDGFTLIELVVAMSMVLVLALSLYSSMRIAFRAQNSAEASVEPSRTAELAMDLIRADIQSAVTPNPNTQNLRVLAGPFVGTQGTDDRGHNDDDLVFCTTAEGPPLATGQSNMPTGNGDNNAYNAPPTGYGDIRQVELNVITSPSNNNEHVLVRRITSNLLTEEQIDPIDEVVCRGVSGFYLQYYDGTDWVNTWDSRDENNTLPIAVRLTLELEREGGTVINNQGTPVMRFTRIFQIPASTAGQTSTQTQ